MSRGTKFAGICALVLLLFSQLSWFGLAADRLRLFPIHVALGTVLLLWFLIRGGVAFLGAAAKERSAAFTSRLVLFTLLFVAAIVLLNVLGLRREFFRYDSTAEDVYTLAPETEQLLTSLPHPLVIRAFFLGGKFDQPKTEDLVSRVVRSSDQIRFEMIDVEKRVSALQKYGISRSGTLHLTLETPDGPREAKITRAISEQEIADAIKKLLRGNPRPVYYLWGHGEPDPENAQEVGYLFLKEAIEGENLELKKLVLANTGGVPADAAAVIFSAPQKPLLEAEREGLRSYLTGGGNALLLHEPRLTDEIAELAGGAGIVIGRDIVIGFEGPSASSRRELGVQPVVTDFAKHPITAEFRHGVQFSTVSSVRVITAEGREAEYVELARTSSETWAESNFELLFGEIPRAALDAQDYRGPVPVAAATAKQRKSGRLVVIGDADFVTNLNIRRLFNRDFFLNCLNWVVGEDRAMALRSKTLRGSTKGISSSEFGLMFSLTAVLFPELLLLLGLAVWWFRDEV